VLDVATIVGASGINLYLLVQLFVVLRKISRQRYWTFCDNVFGERVERQRLQLETERVDFTCVGRVFTIEIQRPPDEVQEILYSGQMPHFFARDLQHEILQRLNLLKQSIALHYSQRIGGVKILHHQSVFDLRRRGKQKNRFVTRF
jgi:hypothetical protein